MYRSEDSGLGFEIPQRMLELFSDIEIVAVRSSEIENGVDQTSVGLHDLLRLVLPDPGRVTCETRAGKPGSASPPTMEMYKDTNGNTSYKWVPKLHPQ